MWDGVRALAGELLGVVTWIAGVAAATLPKRWWPMLDAYVPATDSASISAILTILIAGAVGVPGFISHVTEQVSLNNSAILAAAEGQASRPASAETVSENEWGRMFVGVSSLSIFTFIFLTPAGVTSTYLGISGTWRGIAAAVDDPFGDPILTGVDVLVLGGLRRTRSGFARNRRGMLEGPAVADRVVRASSIGVAGADLVIVAARRKPQWDVGTVVDTGDDWFRVASIEERTIGGRLRTLYGLTAHRDSEAIRRAVRYEMPPRAEGRG
jgi:hypothetical protein